MRMYIRLPSGPRWRMPFPIGYTLINGNTISSIKWTHAMGRRQFGLNIIDLILLIVICSVQDVAVVVTLANHDDVSNGSSVSNLFPY